MYLVLYDILVHGMMVLHRLIYYMKQIRYGIWDMLVVWHTRYGKNTACGMVCVDGIVRENTVYGMVRLWYGTMVRCRGCIIWVNLPGGMV